MHNYKLRYVLNYTMIWRCILAWKIPWTEEPGRLQSMRLLRVGHDWATSLSLFTFMHWRRKWQPTPVFLPGESQGQGSLSIGLHRVGHDWSDLAAAANCTMIWRGLGEQCYSQKEQHVPKDLGQEGTGKIKRLRNQRSLELRQSRRMQKSQSPYLWAGAITVGGCLTD